MKLLAYKVKVKNTDELISKLSELDLTFGSVSLLHDRVFIPRNYKPKSNFPRLILRTEKTAEDRPVRYYLILRRHIEESTVDIFDQTVVKDYAETAKIIQQLSFTMQAEVSRKRQELMLSKGVKLYLDKIDGEETYAKIETEILPDDNIAIVKKDLMTTLRALGAGEISKDTNGELLETK